MNRRQFLQHSVRIGAALGVYTSGTVVRRASAAKAGSAMSKVELESGIEPLVRFIETTPRDRLIEQALDRIRDGLSYRDLLTALLLAGARNIQPRPRVGFQYHALMVPYSAYLAGVWGPDPDRWLPLLWSLDYFKSAQARDEAQGDWSMPPVDESAVPGPRKARQAFVDAMEHWDEPAADAAIAGLARTAGSEEIFELLCRYAIRDLRDIGHKAICVANGWRTLQLMGRQHFEPVLRSIAYALLNHHGEPVPATHDLEPDRPWRENQKRAERMDEGWTGGRRDSGAVESLLAVVRSGSPGDASSSVVDLLNQGVAPESVWEALFAGAAELVLRQPSIVPVHAVTTSNAMHYLWQSAADDHVRRLALLQMASFLPLFREAARGRGELADRRIDRIDPLQLNGREDEAVKQILAELDAQPLQAVGKALAAVERTGQTRPLIDAARRLVCYKADDPHDYKLHSAVAEDHVWLSPQWRRRYLAGTMLYWCTPGEPDNSVSKRVKAVGAG